MDFFVNGEKVEIQLENEKTLGEILSAFETECAKNEAATISIKLNGEAVTAEIFDEAGKTPVDEIKKLELGVVSSMEILTAFKAEAKFARQIAGELEELPAKLQAGKDKEAYSLITNLADLIDNFCHTATLSALFPQKYGTITLGGKSIKEFFADFSTILRDFQDAFSSKDTVLMGDLAEYEISPRIISLAEAAEKL